MAGAKKKIIITVTSRGIHGLSCKRSSGCSTRHQQIKEAIFRALKRVDVPSTKEPAGLLGGNGKRPDVLTLVPWKSGRSLTWVVTLVDTGQLLHANLVSDTLWSGGAAATRKRDKYAEIIQSHIFVSIAIETLGPINMDCQRFLDNLIASANAFLPFPTIQEKPHSYTKD